MLKDLGGELRNLSDGELKIVKARQVGVALSDLSPDEFDVALTGIIFNISVICGCQLPTHEAHVNALEKEFTVFLKEFAFDNLTSEEILTAFRMNANFQLREKIETYGAIFNIDFASKVLSQYRSNRHNLDYKISQIFEQKERDRVLNEEETKRRIKVKEQFAKFLKDENAELDLSNCFMQLVHDNAFIDHNIDKSFLYEAKNETKRVNDTTSFEEALSFAGINLEASFSAGKLAVKYLFKQMKKSGKLEIYDDSLRLIHPGFVMPEQERVKDDF